jgi:DNA-binding transcriptional regulator YbjK
MPPFNAQRRNLVADVAIEVLAEEGARGLTHRAVDSAAAEPPGTTSRYFRTREALRGAVVERVRTLHFADLQAVPPGAVDPAAVADHLAEMVYLAITTHRSRHLAIAELFLEATRRPDLEAELAELRTTQIELVRRVHELAGIPLTTGGARLLVATITGIVQIAITTPHSIGISSPDQVRPLVRHAVGLIHQDRAVDQTAGAL